MLANDAERRCPWKLLDVLAILLAMISFGWLYDIIYRVIFPNMSAGLWSFLIGAVLQAAIVIGLVGYYSLVKYGGEPADLGLDDYPWRRALGLGGLAGITLFFTVIVGATLISLIYPEAPSPQPFAELVMGITSWRELLIPLLIGSVLAPLSEEIFFRGFAYNYFRCRLGTGAALWVSAGFFSLLHLDLLRFVPLMLGGLGLAWLYERTGSLYPSIVAHGVWNGVMTLIIFLGVR